MKPLSQVSLIFACGTALFSDGYVNSVIGTVVAIIRRKFGADVITTNQDTTVTSIGFAGTVVGMLTFGYISDKFGRKFGMMTATGIIVLFSFLSACSQGVNGSTQGLIAALIVFRFFLGVGIGAEYPCGSVAASEQSEEEGIAKNAQNKWFALATNSMIDFGFVIGAFVPLVLWWIFGDKHLDAVWRGTLGFGVIPSSIVFLWRLRMEEPKRYKKDSMKHAKIPYGLIIRRYWRRLLAICVAWFIYDFITYPFGLFSTPILASLEPAGVSYGVVLGWNVVVNLFDMPGTIAGALVVDYFGPKNTMCIGLAIQSIIGFILAGVYPLIKSHVAGFAVFYGIFLTFGEFGPGNCLGLLAAKSGPTAVRGQFYAVAAAVGKVGAFIGTQETEEFFEPKFLSYPPVFPHIVLGFGGSASDRGNSGPFFVGSGLAVVSLLVTWFFVHPLTVDGMQAEDEAFRAYLIEHGWDVSQMGLRDYDDESVSSGKQEHEKEKEPVYS